MTTPTNYEPAPSYNPNGLCFSKCEPACEEPQFLSNQTIFCEDVTILKDLFVVQNLYVAGKIFLDGQELKPTTIMSENGPVVVLAKV